jgi:hypothetical protein
MGKAIRLASIVVAIVVIAVAFAPTGTVLGELAFRAYESLRAGGSSAASASLVPLLAIDAAALLLTLVISFVGGTWLPSGLPHVFFGVFWPLSFGAMQVRFFELSGDPAGLSDTFGTYNFVAMFLVAIALAQLGVHLARWRHERRAAGQPKGA